VGIRAGVDTGGTFTDLVLFDEETGDIRMSKVSSTPSEPSRAVFDSFQKAGLATSDISYFVHGTTVATNALIERRGADVALLTTDGFRDILRIQREVPFGLLTRNIHRWAAHLMVFFVFLHMMRVFYHGAYKPPREFNWVVGVVLLFLTIALSFTGYLLPWDQIAYWAITIGQNLASYVPIVGRPTQLLIFGGVEVSQNTLLRFYVLHVIALPLTIAVFLAVHFWRIRKDGGISGPL